MLPFLSCPSQRMAEWQSLSGPLAQPNERSIFMKCFLFFDILRVSEALLSTLVSQKLPALVSFSLRTFSFAACSCRHKNLLPCGSSSSQWNPQTQPPKPSETGNPLLTQGGDDWDQLGLVKILFSLGSRSTVFLPWWSSDNLNKFLVIFQL